MMPWNEVTKMSLKLEFVRFALKHEVPFSRLCRRFKISRKTGYKLLQRYAEEGESGLSDHSRRPLSSPIKTTSEIEKKIIDLRQLKPSWGSRKIHAYLENKGAKNLPALSTITDILRRNNLIVKRDVPPKAFERFEHVSPNDLWQVDFKGHFAIRTGRCHPLTILDDHSRYSIGLKACRGENTKTVKKHFIEVFEEFGLPFRMNFDNGTPWASSTSKHFRFTELTFWLLRLGIQVSFSKIRRPQTNGKLERFHRTLKSEVLQYEYFWNLKSAQKRFDAWRFEYNHERPHEAIDLKSPVSRYKCSSRLYPADLPDIEYRDTDIIRSVDAGGKISYQNKKIFISEGLKYLPVALRESEGLIGIYFCHQKLLSINLEDY
jgi:transposase InsO family protein